MNTVVALTGLKPGDRLEFLPINHSTIKFSIKRNDIPLKRKDNQEDWMLEKINFYMMTMIARILGESWNLEPRLLERQFFRGNDYAVFLLEN